jgi:hypothetical protein
MPRNSGWGWGSWIFYTRDFGQIAPVAEMINISNVLTCRFVHSSWVWCETQGFVSSCDGLSPWPMSTLRGVNVASLLLRDEYDEGEVFGLEIRGHGRIL